MNLQGALEAQSGGVYRFRPAAMTPQVAQTARRSVARVEARNARDKLAFLNAVAGALRFPDWFGQNWDAFYDCLTERAADPGGDLVIVFDDVSGFARVEPEEFAAAADALRDAAEYWDERGRRLIVLVGIEEPLLATELPELSAG
jgi:RNAse (barnase) inhibitor barstar